MIELERAREQTFRTGVVIALPQFADEIALFSLCAALEARADHFSHGEREVVAVFGFDSEHGETALAVSHIGAQATYLRPDLALLLEAPVLDAVRIDTFVTRAAPEAAIRAELLLVHIARDLAGSFGGIVCDDIGAVYAPEELEDLAAGGRLRQTAFSFTVAAAARYEEVVGAPVALAEIALTLSEGDIAPLESAPDIALDTASIFIAMGPHVPLITAARIAAVAVAAPDIPVVLYAPNLSDADAAVLVAADVLFARMPERLSELLAGRLVDGRVRELVAPTDLSRDELTLFTAASLEPPELRLFIERRALDIARRAAESPTDDLPTIAIAPDAVASGRLPLLLGRFVYPGAILDVYHIAIETAHPLLTALLDARSDVRFALGDRTKHAIVCEMGVARKDGVSPGAFGVSLLAELSARSMSIAQGDSGALFQPSELARLAAARSGIDASWRERAAIAAEFGIV